MLNFDSARRVSVIVGVQSQECARLHNTKRRPFNPHIRFQEYKSDGLTSGTAGILNFGIPVARFPKPPYDPHINSDTLSPSSSMIALARLISEEALFVSNRWTKEFIVVAAEIYGRG